MATTCRGAKALLRVVLVGCIVSDVRLGLRVLYATCCVGVCGVMHLTQRKHTRAVLPPYR